MTPTGAEAPSGGRWSWNEALLVVLGAHVVLFFVGSIVLVAGGWGSSGGDGDPVPITATFAATLPFWIACGAGAWWLARRSGDDPRSALGLSIRPIDVVVGAAVGIGLQFVVIPLVYWPLLRLVGSDTESLERAAQELADSATGVAGVTLFVLMTCFGAPLAEELLYRGLLQRSAGWPDPSPAVAIGVTSVLFGASHLQPLQFVGLLIFGIAVGLLTWRTRRLGPAVVAHVAFNASTVIPLLLRR